MCSVVHHIAFLAWAACFALHMLALSLGMDGAARALLTPMWLLLGVQLGALAVGLLYEVEW